MSQVLVPGVFVKMKAGREKSSQSSDKDEVDSESFRSHVVLNSSANRSLAFLQCFNVSTSTRLECRDREY